MRLLNRLRRPAPPPPTAVLYTMGKVGSTALKEALLRANVTTYHVHSLRPASLAAQVKPFVDRGALPPAHMSVAMAHRDQFITDAPGHRFLTGVRDPLARTLSAFFETLQYRTDGLGPDSEPEVLFRTYLAETDQTYGLGGWFDHEFRDQLGIDVLAQPFDPARRIGQLPDGRGLVFRADCTAEVLAGQVGDLFGCHLTLQRSNTGSDKAYAQAYAAVLAQARFPADLIDRVYTSPFVRHFWSADEQAALAAGWADPDLRTQQRGGR